MAFELHRTIDDQENNPGKTRFRPFHHVRKVATVAGMVRHAVADVAPKISSEWDAAKVASVIHGHREDADSQNRFQFLPVPSLTPVGVSGIRRVLVVGPAGVDIDAFRRRLHGVQLVDCKTQHPMAMLSYLSTKDRSLKDFLDPSPTWTTVTPVILPGYDDPDGLRRRMKTNPVSADEQRRLLERLDARILALIWKAFHQAGWTSDALAGAEVEYRRVGFLRGLDLASRYELPPIKFPRYHLRVRFPRPVSGPIAIGSGRFRGLGFFAAEDDAHL